ncbi:PqqD family protein [Pseudobutyrivibrio sp. UC1225]|uniref:PqqD family protein n=1 Tax=Pseudobutyrivibrio sp. UC1225 TaxID=1798185 RepID=UPI0011604FDB|nr:PqqD family protein [Pseudobutyrivibrio sp. UC1225]
MLSECYKNHHSISEIAQKLSKLFGVDFEVTKSDVEYYVDLLISNKLIVES